MRSVLHITVAAIALWAACSERAAAFQEVPTASTSSLTAPKATVDGLTFDVEQSGKPAGKERKARGRKLPGIGALGDRPKLNFGLDLLYGSDEPADTVAPSFSFSERGEDDLKVLGKIKRRF